MRFWICLPTSVMSLSVGTHEFSNAIKKIASPSNLIWCMLMLAVSLIFGGVVLLSLASILQGDYDTAKIIITILLLAVSLFTARYYYFLRILFAYRSLSICKLDNLVIEKCVVYKIGIPFRYMGNDWRVLNWKSSCGKRKGMTLPVSLSNIQVGQSISIARIKNRNHYPVLVGHR